MTTDTDRLAAEGAELAIAGHTFHVRYPPRALKDLEEHFGSLAEVGRALIRLGQPAARAVDEAAVAAAVARYDVKEITGTELAIELADLAAQEAPVPLFETVFFVLALGLRHETVAGRQITEDWLLDNGDAQAVFRYSEVAFRGLIEALPAQAIATRPTRPSRTTASNGSRGARPSGSRSRSRGSSQRSSGTR